MHLLRNRLEHLDEADLNDAEVLPCPSGNRSLRDLPGMITVTTWPGTRDRVVATTNVCVAKSWSAGPGAKESVCDVAQ